jgi:CDP-glucose 4,6-dehydratase
MDVSPAFWKGKRVFLTGHTGFKGGWLALWLQQLGAELTGYALAPPTEPSLFRLARVAAGMRSVQGDVRDRERLEAALGARRPEIVIHMAAQPLVLPSYVDPVTTYATNVLGTVHLLEAVRRCDSVRVLVNVTSDKCYHNLDHEHGFRETDPMGGVDPYSSSKGCAELVTAAYRHSFFGRGASAPARRRVAVASARAGNVVGGGDWSPYRLVPDMMRALLERRPIVVRRASAVRPWQHVLQPLSGYLKLAERLWEEGEAYAEAWNFGPEPQDAWPVRRVVEHLVRLWGENAGWVDDKRVHPAEAGLLRLDCAKARARLGWRPALPLDTALAWIVEWFKAYRAGEDLRALTQAQIRRYEARVRAAHAGAGASARSA